MTETEKVEATNGNSEHKGAVTGLDKDIIKQVKVYKLKLVGQSWFLILQHCLGGLLLWRLQSA